MNLFVNRRLVLFCNSICVCILFYPVFISASELSISRTPIESEINTLRIAASRSAVDLGLVESIAKQFQKTNPEVKVHISYGGVLDIINDGRNGLADVMLTHHSLAEKRFIEQGYGDYRTQIMFTEYALFGPPDAESRYRDEKGIVEVLQQLAEDEVDFIVPSSKSGTYMKVDELWTGAGISPDWPGYENSGSSGYSTLLMAAELGYYTIVEMGTYLANKEKVNGKLSLIYRGDMYLRNTYSLIVVNPQDGKLVNTILAYKFLDYLVSDDAQQFISDYSESKFNSMVFLPAAHLDQGLKQRRESARLVQQQERVNDLRIVLVIMALLFFITGMLYLRTRFLQSKHISEKIRVEIIKRQRDKSIEINKTLENEIKIRRNIERQLSETLKLLQQSEAKLSEEKEKSEITLQSIGDAVITTDINGRIEFANEISGRIIGKTVIELAGSNVEEEIQIIEENSNKKIENSAIRCLRDKVVVEQDVDHILLRSDGRQLPVIESAAPIHDRQGDFIGVVMVLHDVSNSRRVARQLSYQATHDGLTGVYNRRAFEMHLEGAIEEACKENNTHALCFIDLDKFKIVNDTCGHKEGDDLLKLFTRLVQSRLRESDMFARLGGDEFGILLRYCSIERAIEISEGLRQAIYDYNFVIGGQCFEIGVSIGITEISSASESLTQLLSNADIACYVAKDTGGNSVYVYKPDNAEIEQHHGNMKWVTRINRALENNDFSLSYQPIATIKPDVFPYQCYEIFLRLRDDDGSFISPNMFIPAAERYSLMPLIDLRNIHQTMEFLRDRVLDEDSIFFINLSGQSIASDSFFNSVDLLFDQYKIHPGNVCFEITETAVIADIDKAKRFISHFSEKGAYFALDDFGTGLSSFSYLKNLKVDFIKIDGEFTMSMLDDVVSRAMVETTIHMGEAVGITIIVECVESQPVLEELMILGADFVQGYYVKEPTPLSDWESFDDMSFYANEKLNIKSRLDQDHLAFKKHGSTILHV